MVIAVITAVIIVLAMNLVGSLLITALLIFPALSAMRVMKSFKAVIIYSAVISVVGATIGLLVSILFSTPVGATIVVVDMLVFAVNCVVGKILGRN
jgi:zinc transport system permease protein